MIPQKIVMGLGQFKFSFASFVTPPATLTQIHIKQ
jgi:hypothetical protein